MDLGLRRKKLMLMQNTTLGKFLEKSKKFLGKFFEQSKNFLEGVPPEPEA